MAFTDTQKATIRMYLGWGARYLQTDDALRRAYDSVGALGGADQVLVEAQLTECARIDAALVAAEPRLKADQVGPIKLNAAELDQLRDKGRMAVARMARIFGVEVRGDPYSPGLPSERASIWGMSGGDGYQLMG